MTTKASTLLLTLLLLGTGCIGVTGDASSEPASASEEPRDEETPPESDEDARDSSPEEEEGEVTGNVTELTSVWKNTTIRGANPGLGLHWVSGENELPFDVPEGAEAVIVEAAWSEDVALNLSVNDPNGPQCDSEGPVSTYFDCEPTRAEDGESPLLVRVTGDDIRSGEWEAGLFVDSPVPREAQVTLLATIVEEGDVPGGFARLT